MNRTALRVVTAALAAACVATWSVGPASAARTADGAPEPNPALAAALRTARDTYRASVADARLTLASAMTGLRAEVLDEAGTDRSATVAARVRHQGDVDIAFGAARSDILTARTIYLTTAAAAYAQFAPGQPMPRGVPDAWAPGPADRPWPDPADRSRSSR